MYGRVESLSMAACNGVVTFPLSKCDGVGLTSESADPLSNELSDKSQSRAVGLDVLSNSDIRAMLAISGRCTH